MTGNTSFRLLLVLLALAVILCEAGSAARQLQTPVESEEVSFTDNNNPCSICQGLTLQAEKMPRPEIFNNATCGEMNAVFENQPETMGTTYDSCRGEILFNMLFDDCCRPSIPMYQCEQNVQNYISEQDYSTLVPPIVGNEPDEKLYVDVALIYQALENIEVEEGEP